MKLQASQRLLAAATWLGPALEKFFLKVQDNEDTMNWCMVEDANREFGNKFKDSKAYWKYLCKVYSGPYILVNRYVHLKDFDAATIRKLGAKPGVHWSSKEMTPSDPLSRAYSSTVRVYAQVKKSDVDLKATVHNRIQFPFEQETTLKPDAIPTIVKIIATKTRLELWPKREMK